MKMILETERLFLREIQHSDYADISAFLQDIDVMYAWEHAFSDAEVAEWIEKNLSYYAKYGYSYWAVIEKQSDKLIGVAGLLPEKANDEDYVGIGYIFNKNYWNNGYAYESAKACVDYGFDILKLNEVTAQIRPENAASIKLAKKLGMAAKKEFIKRYKGKDMPHILFSLQNK